MVKDDGTGEAPRWQWVLYDGDRSTGVRIASGWSFTRWTAIFAGKRAYRREAKRRSRAAIEATVIHLKEDKG